jgi:adenylate cyclase
MQHKPKSNPRASVLPPEGTGLAYLEGLFASEAGWPLAPIIAWILGDGRRTVEPARFFAQLCGKLSEAGAPAWRFGLDVTTMHPRFAAWQLTWTREGGRVNERRVGHGFRETDAYIGTPAESIHETGAEIHHRLDRLDPRLDHPYLFYLAARGGTDYVALPLEFSTGEKDFLCIATDRPGGFSELDLAKFRVLAELIALPLESFVAHCTALALVETYVGPRAGRRVLQGRIRRGDGEAIDAAVWYSDLRDFTPLSESLPWERLLEILNAYFEFIDAAVTAQGGEILHFIGDAVLVVFPTSAKGGRGRACKAALEAARDAFNGIATVNMRRNRAGAPGIRFGIGLHVGEVVYGNVGTPDRFDFTVMGAAVNRAARLQSLTKELARPVLISADFAACIEEPVESLGCHTMKGLQEPQQIFAVDGL